MNLNIELSRRIQELYPPQPKTCFKNAIMAMNPNFKYAEGNISLKVMGNLPLTMEHGFLIFENQIIEPTLSDFDEIINYEVQTEFTFDQAMFFMKNKIDQPFRIFGSKLFDKMPK